MLIQILIQQPQMLGTILKNTPMWVWGLLAGLVALGLSQVRDRVAGWTRVTLLPVSMTAMSIWGTTSAFGASPSYGAVMLMWFVATLLVMAVVAPLSAPRDAAYDSASRRFQIP